MTDSQECSLKTLYEGVLLEMQQGQEDKATEELSELQQTIESLCSMQEKVEQDAAE